MKRQIALLKSHKMTNFSKKYRIYYEDTDAQGVVYYANYLKFFERARTDFLREKEILQTELKKSQNLQFVVRKCEIEYFSPARLDDLIEISVEIEKIGFTSLTMRQKAFLDEKILCESKVEIVAVDCLDFKPKRIGEDLKNRLL